MDISGEAKPFAIEDQEDMVANVIEPMAKDGLRTISVAYKDYVLCKGWCRVLTWPPMAPSYNSSFACSESRGE